MIYFAGSSFLLLSIIFSGTEQSLPQLEQQVDLPNYFEDDLQPTNLWRHNFFFNSEFWNLVNFTIAQNFGEILAKLKKKNSIHSYFDMAIETRYIQFPMNILKVILKRPKWDNWLM